MNRRQLLSLCGLTAISALTTKSVLESQAQAESNKFAQTLSGQFLDLIQETIQIVDTKPRIELGHNFHAPLQEIHDSHAQIITNIPDSYSQRIQNPTQITTLIDQPTSIFNKSFQQIQTNFNPEAPFTSISEILQMHRHNQLNTQNPFNIPDDLKMAYLYASAFEFNNVILKDFLLGIYTEGQVVPEISRYTSKETYQAQMLSFLKVNQAEPNTLWSQVEQEHILATTYFNSYKLPNSEKTSIAGTNMFVSQEFIDLTAQKLEPSNKSFLYPILPTVTT